MAEEEDVEVADEDYYAFLNLAKEASQEEITNAYRRLSRIYHPDKHPAEKKKQAEVLFNKTKKAYEVLSDPHKRAIYDNLGVKGLETEGWEVIQRTRTPQEIREEYERLAREQEERRRQQRTNPKGNVTVNINATSLFPVHSYYDEEDEQFEYYRESPSLLDVEIRGLSFDMSTEAPLTAKDTAVLAGSVNTSNGTGSGNVVASVRRITSPKGWLEFEVGAGNGLSLTTRTYRSLSQRVFCTCGAMAVTKRRPGGLAVQPGLFATLGTQLDKNTLGYLTWKGGASSGMTSKVVRDTQYGSISGVIHLGIPHSFISLSCTKKFSDGDVKLKGAAQLGTFGGNLEYGIVKKISKFSFLSATMSVGVPSGVILKIRLTRSSQAYNFPIHLCDEIVSSAVFYGTVVPLGCYFAVTRLIIQPYKARQKAVDLQKQKEQYKTELAEKRREAEASIELMRATFDRIVAEEEGRKGLVITRALYGRLVGDADERAPDVICVTVPLQCLVKDSKLILHENSKVQLPGFFDPCLGEEKQLKVSYLFRGLPHEVTVADTEGLRIPRQSHRVNGT